MESDLEMEDVKQDNIGGIDDMEAYKPTQTVDIYQFEGKQVPIERIKIDKIKSKFGVDGQQLPPGKEILAPILKVETVPVFKGKNSKGEDYEIRASEIFSLKEKLDEKTGKTKIGWSEHEKGALNKFLKKMRVKHPKELVGKIVLLTPRPTKDPEVSFLGFVRA